MAWGPASFEERLDATRIYAVTISGTAAAIAAGRVRLEELGTVILKSRNFGEGTFKVSTTLWLPSVDSYGITVRSAHLEMLSRMGVPNVCAFYSTSVESTPRAAYLAVVDAHGGPLDEDMAPLELAIGLGFLVTMGPFALLLISGLQAGFAGGRIAYQATENAIRLAGELGRNILNAPARAADAFLDLVKKALLYGGIALGGGILLYSASSGRTVGRVITDISKGLVDGGAYLTKTTAKTIKAVS